ncbi:MAG: mitochondrial small ribosomal subunit protein uS9m [Candidatus Levybacteria bacterium]|nr:mitochondrial small ribosomal subunit protein uS9m [Candidatus Levybacteria bacterium]
MVTKKTSEEATEVRTPYNKKSKRSYTGAVGRRREAVARVRLHTSVISWEGIDVKPGEVYVNHKLIGEYFKDTNAKAAFEEILKSSNVATKYGFTIKVSGGGTKGQLNAVLHGIANAMVALDEKHRPVLKKKGLMTRDSRVRQRRKVGMGGKSRRKRQSPKR